VDQHPKWESIPNGGKLQRDLALLLHEEAQVPFGPCSYDELTQFSAAPSLYEYHILLVNTDRTFHVSTFGPPSSKQLILLHENGMMSSPVFLGFSGPVTCVPTASNPMTMQDVIDVKPTTKKSSAAPVSKKSAPISSTLTNAVSKPPYVAMLVDATFSATSVSKPITPKTWLERPLTPPNPPSASLDVSVWDVSSLKWVSNTFNVIVVGTLTALPAISTSMLNPTVATFKKHPPLKKCKNTNENVNVKEGLQPNGVLPRVFKPCELMRRRRKKKDKTFTKKKKNFHPCTCSLTSKPWNPKNTM